MNGVDLDGEIERKIAKNPHCRGHPEFPRPCLGAP